MTCRQCLSDYCGVEGIRLTIHETMDQFAWLYAHQDPTDEVIDEWFDSLDSQLDEFASRLTDDRCEKERNA